MDEWSSLYANLYKNAPALAASTKHVHANPRQRHDSQRRKDWNRAIPPHIFVEDSESEESQSEEEVEIDEEELYEVFQGRRPPKKFGGKKFLEPPQPYLHRNPNHEGHVERQRLRKYESDPVRRGPSTTEDKGLAPESRSASLPVITPLTTSPTKLNGSASPPGQIVMPRPRKGRPSPLDLAPPSPLRKAGRNSDPPTTPYSASIFSLYSASISSSNSTPRSNSLPLFAFLPSDFPSQPTPRAASPRQSMSPPKAGYTSPPPLRSPRDSIGSLDTVRSSLSLPDVCMPTAPTPTAVSKSRKERVYNTVAAIDMARMTRGKI